MSIAKPIAIVIGDPVLDRYIEGAMRRISPEAPVPIVLQQAVRETPGGAANVAVNIKSLGGEAFFAGSRGLDPAGDTLVRLLCETYGISACWSVQPAAAYRTPTKTRVTVGGQQVLRIDDEQPPANVAHVEDLIRGLEWAVGSPTSAVRLLVVADYAKGCITDELAAYLLALSGRKQIPLFVDAKPAVLRRWAGASLIKINRGEALQIAQDDGWVHPGLELADAAAELAVDYLRKTYRFGMVAVTCGPAGVVYWDGTQIGSVPTTSQQVYDVTGAGDVFLAALAVSYLDGGGFVEALFRANIAAGLSVQQHGTVTITRDALEDAILTHRGWSAKLMGPEAAVAFAQRKRAAGKSLVLANGCFDALHVGHIQTLAHAKRHGDVLVVAYNDDASIRQLKGENRPIVAEPFRAAQLAMLETVDCVTQFDGDVEALVRRLHPDILVKGQQYREMVVPGAEFVSRHGGRVVFAPMVPHLSTTEIHARTTP